MTAIAPDTSIGAVHLTVSDVHHLSAFYVRHLGMRVLKQKGDVVRLGAGSRELLVLHESPGAKRPQGTTGLYHFAILVPSRLELARSLRLLVDTGTSLQGASDHGVSEALYLADPDGNGIEIYRDRPRIEWPRANGSVQMGVDPLDLDGVMAELDGKDAAGGQARELHGGTVMGHVHLQVSNLSVAEAFYCGVLGFDVMLRYGRGALFVSAGGYHHHLGLNTWAGVGLPPAPAGSLGLRHFDVRMPSEAARAEVVAELREGLVSFTDEEGGILARDPSGNALRLTA